MDLDQGCLGRGGKRLDRLKHVLEAVLSGFVNVLDMSRDGNKGTRDTSS